MSDAAHGDWHTAAAAFKTRKPCRYCGEFTTAGVKQTKNKTWRRCCAACAAKWFGVKGA